MRTIKFRGKRTDTGEWVFGDLLHREAAPKSISNVQVNGSGVIEETVGQLICIIPNTSMYVDNSQELYEGDLFTSGNSNTVYQAVYDGGGEYYGISNEGDEYGSYTIRLSCDNVERRNLKIVGNIHDNPELLKGGKE